MVTFKRPSRVGIFPVEVIVCHGQMDRVWRNGVIIELYSGMMY